MMRFFLFFLCVVSIAFAQDSSLEEGYFVAQTAAKLHPSLTTRKPAFSFSIEDCFMRDKVIDCLEKFSVFFRENVAFLNYYCAQISPNQIYSEDLIFNRQVIEEKQRLLYRMSLAFEDSIKQWNVMTTYAKKAYNMAVGLTDKDRIRLGLFANMVGPQLQEKFALYKAYAREVENILAFFSARYGTYRKARLAQGHGIRFQLSADEKIFLRGRSQLVALAKKVQALEDQAEKDLQDFFEKYHISQQ